MIGLIVAIYEGEFGFVLPYKSVVSYLHWPVGCFLGSVTTSFIGEGLGRRKTIAGGVVIMIVGALLQSTAYTRAHMIVARIVSGYVSSTEGICLFEILTSPTRAWVPLILPFLSYKPNSPLKLLVDSVRMLSMNDLFVTRIIQTELTTRLNSRLCAAVYIELWHLRGLLD